MLPETIFEEPLCFDDKPGPAPYTPGWFPCTGGYYWHRAAYGHHEIVYVKFGITGMEAESVETGREIYPGSDKGCFIAYIPYPDEPQY